MIAERLSPRRPEASTETRTASEAARDYARVARAIEYVRATRDAHPDLDELARHAGMSAFHFQRVFTRWAGVSPKKFLQFLTLEHARARLAASATVLDTAFDVGLSGPARLHDLFVQHEALTPGEFRRGAEGLAVRYGFAPSPFGEALAAVTERGLCALSFVDAGERQGALAALRERLPRASLVRDDDAAGALLARVFHNRPTPRGPEPLRLFLRGTRFQLKVWEALLRVPAGACATYEDLAARVGHPGSARAVASAVASNPVGYVIPCHRVLRKSGALGGYRWGETRKLCLLGWELAR